MALLTTILVALSPLLQPANAELKLGEPVVSSPTPGGAASQAGRALPASPPAPPESPADKVPVGARESAGSTHISEAHTTPVLASWYGERPVACDGLPVPWWVKDWTASLTLPCGSLVRLSGPAGTVTVPIEDRGPERWTGRSFDLTPGAFAAVAGSLATGVVPVEWSPAG